jgi:hypothetical protein
LVASSRFVRSRDNACEFVLGFLQRAQCRQADFTRADKNDAHSQLLHQLHGSAARAISRGHRLHQHFVAGGYFTLSNRRPAFGTKVIKDLLVWQN